MAGEKSLRKGALVTERTSDEKQSGEKTIRRRRRTEKETQEKSTREKKITLQRDYKETYKGHVTRHDSLSKTILQGTLEGGRRVVGRGNAEWTTSKCGHPCPCQNCSQGRPAEKTGRRSLLNRPSSSPPPTDYLIGQRTELN